jgi:hypothetical protein
MGDKSRRIRSPSQESSACSRRALAHGALAGIGLALVRADEARGQRPEAQRVLQRGDRIDLGGKEAAIVETAYNLGREYERRYGGCAQCAVAALQDAIPFVETDVGLFRGAGCLDGGATPTGLQNCGSFTGSGMVIGYVCARMRDEIFFGSNELAHKLMREVYRHFEKEYGSVLCKDVRAKAKADCPQVVGNAARWTAEVLLEAFADYRSPVAASPPPPTFKSPKCQGDAPFRPHAK